MGMFGMVSNFNYSTIAPSKGKAKEIDFEAAFAQFTESMASPPEQGSSLIEITDETTEELERALTNVSLEENEGQETDNAAEGYVTHIDRAVYHYILPSASGKTF